MLSAAYLDIQHIHDLDLTLEAHQKITLEKIKTLQLQQIDILNGSTQDTFYDSHAYLDNLMEEISTTWQPSYHIGPLVSTIRPDDQAN